MLLVRTPRVAPLIAILTAALVVGLTGCGQEGWNDEARSSLRRDMCVAFFRVDAQSNDCGCLVDAVVENYESPDDYRDSAAPSSEYRADVERCGFAIIPR